MGDWEGGKHAGNYIFNGVSYITRLMHNYRTYQKYFKKEDEAKKWLMDLSIELGIVRNKHRMVEIDGKQCVEVQLTDNKTFICDLEDFPFIDLCVWSIQKSRNTHYVYGTVTRNEKVYFIE